MERLSSIANKTFVDDLRSDITPSKAEAAAESMPSLAPPAPKKPAKATQKNSQRTIPLNVVLL